ncbi:MAG: hypothetical protein IPJ65_08675 [Archangiaceae bacterium]|nr:hypothetical protein [Archangiaceae bacterium]
MSDGERPLPAALLRVTLCALVLAGLVGFGAVHGLTNLLAPSREVDFKKVELPPGYREALEAVALAELAAYEGMRSSRAVILIGIWAFSALVFVAALRMLKPQGAAREGVRRMLGGALLATAVLRTLEGAQSAAVARKAGRALDKVLSSRPELAQPYSLGSEYAALVLSVGLSFVVGGSLLMMSRYYRSQTVRETCAALDEP